MIFRNRHDAGVQLAAKLRPWTNHSNAVVLAIPRGGVHVGFAMAQALHLPLDILLARRLGVPGHEDLAFGAVAPGGIRHLDRGLVEAFSMTWDDVERITEEAIEILRREDRLYRANRSPLDVRGRAAILVDDGIATGASMIVAIRALRIMKPARLIVAVPVAPPSARKRLASMVDEFLCLHELTDFKTVGQFYEDSSSASDAEIIELLERFEHSEKTHHGSGHLSPA